MRFIQTRQDLVSTSRQNFNRYMAFPIGNMSRLFLKHIWISYRLSMSLQPFNTQRLSLSVIYFHDFPYHLSMPRQGKSFVFSYSLKLITESILTTEFIQKSATSCMPQVSRTCLPSRSTCDHPHIFQGVGVLLLRFETYLLCFVD